MLELIRDALSCHPWRDLIHYFPTIDSTNNYAKTLALQGAPHGTVVIASHQSGGRGRMGRSFSSPENMGVYLSLLLRPQCSPAELMHLTCACAVAGCNAVETAIGLRPQIKWTNDLLLNKRKVGGILTELVIGPQEICAIIGIGINCRQEITDFPQEIQSFAGSLSMASQKDISLPHVIYCLLESLLEMDRHLLTERDTMIARYTQDCATIGQDISLVCGDRIRHGHAIAIASDGGLVVRFSDGHEEIVQSGEVSIRGMYGYV